MKKLKTKFISATVFCSGLVLLVFQFGCQVAQTQENSSQVLTTPTPLLPPKVSRQWKPGVYHGIVTGQSTREDVIRKFGKPEWEGERVGIEEEYQSDETVFTMIYKNIGGMSGETEVGYVKKGKIVESIIIFPDKNLTERDIIAKYGDNYLRVESPNDICAVISADNPKQPLPKDAEGYMVYPELGMYVGVQIDFRLKCGEESRKQQP